MSAPLRTRAVPVFTRLFGFLHQYARQASGASQVFAGGGADAPDWEAYFRVNGIPNVNVDVQDAMIRRFWESVGAPTDAPAWFFKLLSHKGDIETAAARYAAETGGDPAPLFELWKNGLDYDALHGFVQATGTAAPADIEGVEYGAFSGWLDTVSRHPYWLAAAVVAVAAGGIGAYVYYSRLDRFVEEEEKENDEEVD